MSQIVYAIGIFNSEEVTRAAKRALGSGFRVCANIEWMVPAPSLGIPFEHVTLWTPNTGSNIGKFLSGVEYKLLWEDLVFKPLASKGLIQRLGNTYFMPHIFASQIERMCVDFLRGPMTLPYFDGCIEAAEGLRAVFA